MSNFKDSDNEEIIMIGSGRKYLDKEHKDEKDIQISPKMIPQSKFKSVK